MPTNVIMPQMGESIFEGTITKWLRKVGEKVQRDEPLFEISTDKVDSEIPSPASGTLAEILVPEGKTVQINTVVASIAGEEDAATHASAKAESVPAPSAPPRAEPAPEPVPLAAPPVPAPVPQAKPVTALAPPPAPPRVAGAPAEIRTSPLVRRMAREHQIDLGAVKGTGLSGRITKQDILDYLERKAAPEPAVAAAQGFEPLAAAPAPLQEPVSAPPVEAPTSLTAVEAPRIPGETEVVPMSVMRRAIAEHMVMSKRTSAHVNSIFEIDLTSVVRLRERHKDEFEKREGVKLTFTPFFVKALVDTVRDFPVLNCSVQGETIVYKKAINVGIAVALETGLIVPVVKDAHLKSFTGIALAIQDLAGRARTKRLRPDEVQNGTISITNPGIYGSLFGTPIISQPQVAILGVGGIEKRPVVVNDAIAIRSMVYLSLSFDHRVIDGAVADQFMASLKKRLESWTVLEG